MCIEAQNTATICLICRDSMAYSYFRHKHCDDLFNLSRFYDIFLFFVMDVHRWILKPKPSRRVVKFVAIWPQHRDVLVDSSRSPHQHLGPTTLPCMRRLTQAPRHHHVSAQGPPHCHAGTTSRRRHITATRAPRAHHTATQAPPHPDATSLPRKHLGPTHCHASATSPKA
jgi:hypothetical protein